MLFIFFVFQYTFAHLSLYIYTYICIFTYKYICYHWPTQFTHDSVFILIGCVDIPTSFFTDVPFTRPPSCLIAWWVEAALHPWISTILDFHVSFLCGKLTWLENHSLTWLENHIFIFSGFFKFRYVCSPDPLIGGKTMFFFEWYCVTGCFCRTTALPKTIMGPPRTSQKETHRPTPGFQVSMLTLGGAGICCCLDVIPNYFKKHL